MTTSGRPYLTLNPTFEPPKTQESVKTTAARPKTLDGAVVGILSNGKTNGMALLEALVEELRGRYAIAGVIEATKGSVSIPPRPEDYEKFVREATVVLTAIGD